MRYSVACTYLSPFVPDYRSSDVDPCWRSLPQFPAAIYRFVSFYLEYPFKEKELLVPGKLATVLLS